MSEPEPRSVCPTCLPETDPFADFVVVGYCAEHCPDVRGADDLVANPLGEQCATGGDGGENGGPWCALIHRGRP